MEAGLCCKETRTVGEVLSFKRENTHAALGGGSWEADGVMFFSCFGRRASSRVGNCTVTLAHKTDVKTGEAARATAARATSTTTVNVQTSTRRRGWAVFWDFENMALWKRYPSVADILQTVRASLTTLSGTNVHDHVTLFVGIGNTELLPTQVNSNLKLHGVTTMNSISRRKNAADVVIVTEIMRCLIESPPEGICLISNDGDFCHCMKIVKQLGYGTALLHDNAALALEAAIGSECTIDLSTTYVYKAISSGKNRYKKQQKQKQHQQQQHLFHLQRSTNRHWQHTPPHFPPPAYFATTDRPGLKHMLQALEIAGGQLEYQQLKQHLGKMPRGWFENLLQSGKALNRLSTYGNRIMLCPSY